MQTFTEVVFKRDGFGKAAEGILTIGTDYIQFEGQEESLGLRNIQFVSLEKPSGLGMGDWVKVAYGDLEQPAAAYFKVKKNADGVNQLYLALQHFPNSQQFECRIWTQYRRRLRVALSTAPRKFWGFTTLKKGVIAATRAQTLSLSARRLKKREIAIEEIISFQREQLTVNQQLRSMGLTILMVGVGLGLLVSVISLLQRSGNAEVSLMGFLNLFALFLGVGIVLGFLWAIPTLPRMRTFNLFTLKFKNGQKWEFGIPEAQADEVARILGSFGIENQPG